MPERMVAGRSSLVVLEGSLTNSTCDA